MKLILKLNMQEQNKVTDCNRYVLVLDASCLTAWSAKEKEVLTLLSF